MAKRAEKSSALFLQIVGNGKLGMWVKEPTKFSEALTDKDGKTRNYEFFESMTGRLLGCYVYDKELEGDRVFEMMAIKLKNSEGETEILTMPFKSGYAASLIKRLEAIKLETDVTLKSFKILDDEKSDEKGKKIYNMLCLPYQDKDDKGKLKTIPSLYTKDSGNELPQAKSSVKKVKGVSVTTWDFADLEEALRNIVVKVNEAAKEYNDSLMPVEKTQDLNSMSTLTVEDVDLSENENLPFDNE